MKHHNIILIFARVKKNDIAQKGQPNTESKREIDDWVDMKKIEGIYTSSNWKSQTSKNTK